MTIGEKNIASVAVSGAHPFFPGRTGESGGTDPAIGSIPHDQQFGWIAPDGFFADGRIFVFTGITGSEIFIIALRKIIAVVPVFRIGGIVRFGGWTYVFGVPPMCRPLFLPEGAINDISISFFRPVACHHAFFLRRLEHICTVQWIVFPEIVGIKGKRFAGSGEIV